MADRPPAKNVLGEPLVSCGLDTVTGFYRDSCCDTGPEDLGSRTFDAIARSWIVASRTRSATR